MVSEWISRMRDRWSYQVFGPTTIHLEHEFYLLIALALLTISSLQALYKNSFGTSGDIRFVALVSLWLSRHLILRWLCTTDKSTNLSPSLLGVLVHWLTSYITAGQFFDRPNPQVVGKQIGTNHGDDGRTGATISSFFLPSMLFTWQYVKVWIFYPILRLQEQTLAVFGENGGQNSTSTTTVTKRGRDKSSSHSSSSLTINQTYSYWSKFWHMYGPSLQMIIPIVTMAYYFWFLFFSKSQPEVSHALTMNTRSTLGSDFSASDIKPYGAYQKMTKPTWAQVMFYVSCGGTLISILLYGRIIYPIADLVAGTNVLKAVRNESKLHGSQSSSSKTSKSKLNREQVDVPWAEQYKSIAGENRFRLICKIAGVRLLENLFICALMPRTAFSCRATGHCPEGASIVELAKVLFPVGITSALRTDGSFHSQFSLITPDRGSAVMTVLSSVIITWAILLSQAATLNRAYLGIMGYIAGEWTVVTRSDPSFNGSPLSQWDPRRRYKKGDLIVQNYPGFGVQSIYKATSNSPEGRPFDLYLRATHDLFRNELGHPATSNVVAYILGVQLVMIFVITVMIICYHFLNYYCVSLLWTLAANIVAAFGTVGVALPRYREYHRLAKQISA